MTASPVNENDLCCTSLTTEVIAEADAIELGAVLKALSDPVRLRLVSILAASAADEVCACDLPTLLGRSQPTVSHHLGLLQQAGLIEREQRGKWAWFRLRPERLKELSALLGDAAG